MSELPLLPTTVRAQLAPEVFSYVAALEAAVVGLTARVAELEARLGQNSTNSSRPPSSDLPGTRRAPSAPKGTRPRGGQRGHGGRFRTPTLTPTTVTTHLPPACAACAHPLAATAGPADPADWVHQVTEIPPLVAIVSEHRRAARRCPACGHCTRATLPADVPAGAFGIHLQALTAVLTGRFRLSKREAAECLATLFGVPVAVGSIHAMEQTVSTALLPAVTAARAAVTQAPTVHLDETGWRQGGQRAWLWTAVTPTATVFHIDPHRRRAVLTALVGPASTAVVIADRYSAYAAWPLDRRQVCWAHLLRDFQHLVDAGPTARPTGEQLQDCGQHLFHHWHRFQAGALTRPELVQAIGQVALAMRGVLEAGQIAAAPRAQTLSRELLKVWPALWTFALNDGVAPTNNAAERALRPAVLHRKGSFGTQSAAGSRFVERVLTVHATLRRQGRRLVTFLVDTLAATQGSLPPPALLPDPAPS